jgi:hypothetical protein
VTKLWVAKHAHWWSRWFPSRCIVGALVRTCMADGCEATEYLGGPDWVHGV